MPSAGIQILVSNLDNLQTAVRSADGRCIMLGGNFYPMQSQERLNRRGGRRESQHVAGLETFQVLEP
jgi:hypothetical protein